MYKKAPTATCPTGTAVSVRHLTKTFEQWQRTGRPQDILKNLLRPQKRTITALNNVSFEVERGEFVAYAGPNGAGKSTTMKLLTGMLMPKEGEISVLGMSPLKQRIPLMRRLGVLFGNRTELWFDHPVLQSFEWKRVIWDIPKDRYQQNVTLLTDLLDLGDILHTFARELSLGQRMKADLALMLLHDPEIILLDEPTIGLDVLAKRQMIGFLKELNEQRGTTILVTSHDMDDLEEMARRILLISKGDIAFDGSFSGLRHSTGDLCRIALTFRSPQAPDLPSAKRISHRETVCEYEFNALETPVTTVLAEVSALPGVEDVEIRKAPIEEVIAGLYQSWVRG